MKTLKLHIRDKHIDQLNRLSGSVNFVWNYVNDLSYHYLQRTGKFVSAYDLNEYTKVVVNYWACTLKPFKLSMKSTPKAENNLKMVLVKKRLG